MYERRRQRLLNKLGDGVLILPTAAHPLRNGDVRHDFRPGSDLHYLTGFAEPRSILVAWRTGSDAHQSVLFVPPRNKEREIWDGPRAGVRGAVHEHGMDEAFPIAEFGKQLPELLKDQRQVFHTLTVDPQLDKQLFQVFQKIAQEKRRRNPPIHPTIQDPRPAIAEMRLIKDAEEIRRLEEAVRITVDGHKQAMACVRPGMLEYQLQAVIENEFRKQGSRRNGYESIVASGANACVLHYIKNDRKIRRGDLVLIDAGAEFEQYTADITRTFPASGTFSEPQKAIYQAVLAAEKAAIKAVKPGAFLDAPHKASIRVLTRELVKIGILRGNMKRLLKKLACRKWFVHGTSHWLGMDVHDVGTYEDEKGKPDRFRPGMVCTIEPGLYFGNRDRSVAKEFRGIGVRIEDDVLVTRTGCRVLTAAMPKEVRDVEALCQSGL